MLENATEGGGTVFAELADGPAAAPDEPAWMRDLASPTDEDPAARPRPNPEAAAAARAARAEQIVRALNPEQARAVTTTEGPLLILAGLGVGGLAVALAAQKTDYWPICAQCVR